MECPPDDVVQRFVSNLADEAERTAFGAHLADCSKCLERVTSLSLSADVPIGSETRDLEGQSPTTGTERPPLTRGTVIGRYVVLDVLGRGGMGEVYAAFDPELDRKVAVKVVKSDDSYGEQHNETRLFREAQAMARLSHPNVVPVYDVGLFDGRVFLAMELVSGTTVKRWLKEAPRPWREVVRVYRAAGEGLSAAHKSGMVHRDFKPDNVLIGDDGRVRVLDFGLAKTARTGAVKVNPHELQAHSLLETDITQAASVLGTPAYMAPERLSGAAEDTRTDQFSFCVALYEGLYGEKPFEGATAERMVASIMQGTIRPPAAGRDVPSWLRKLVVRGLSKNPSDRFASMDALVEALGVDVGGRRQQRVLVGAVALAVTALIAGAWRSASQRASLCHGFESHLAGVWDDSVRASTRAVFERVSGPLGVDAYQRAAKLLDSWTQSWLETRTSVCEATRVRGEQSEQVLSVRMACLDQALMSARSAVTVFGTADAPTILKAVDVAAALPRLDACANTAKLLSELPAPETKGATQRIQQTRSLVADARAIYEAARYERSRELADRAVTEAQAIGWAPLTADAVYTLAKATERLGDPKAATEKYHLAASYAYAARNDELVARATARVAYCLGYLLNQQEEAQRWLAIAHSAIERAGTPDLLEADVSDMAGIVEVAAGHVAEATRLVDHCVTIRKRVLGENNLDTARAMSHLAFMVSLGGDRARALAMQHSVLEIDRRMLGDHHPDLAEVLIAIGNTHHQAGEFELALKAYRQAQEILEAALGPDHSDVIVAINNVGAALNGLQRFEEALEVERRALAMKEKLLGPEHADVSTILGNIGQTLGALGRHDEAIATIRRAIGISEKALGPEHPSTILIVAQLGEEFVGAGRRQEALTQFEQALKLAERSQMEPRRHSNLKLQYVRTLADVGQVARARASLQSFREGLVANGFTDDVTSLEKSLGEKH